MGRGFIDMIQVVLIVVVGFFGVCLLGVILEAHTDAVIKRQQEKDRERRAYEKASNQRRDVQGGAGGDSD